MGFARDKEGTGRAPVEAEAVRALHDLLARAILVQSKPDHAGDINILAMHRLYAPLGFDGRLWRAKLTVKETVTGRRLYDHRLTEWEEAGAVTKEGVATTADGAARLGPSPTCTINVGKLLAGVNFDDGVPVSPDRLSDLAPSRDVSYAAPPPMPSKPPSPAERSDHGPHETRHPRRLRRRRPRRHRDKLNDWVLNRVLDRVEEVRTRIGAETGAAGANRNRGDRNHRRRKFRPSAGVTPMGDARP